HSLRSPTPFRQISHTDVCRADFSDFRGIRVVDRFQQNDLDDFHRRPAQVRFVLIKRIPLGIILDRAEADCRVISQYKSSLSYIENLVSRPIWLSMCSAKRKSKAEI
ncbi:MAG: hypothetical protein ABJV68_18235, partial [Paracoccaceae bacterium]